MDPRARWDPMSAARSDVPKTGGTAGGPTSRPGCIVGMVAAQAARQVPGVKAVNTAGVHLAGTIIKEKEPEKEQPKEPPKEPPKESAKEPVKESGKESPKEPTKESTKEPVKEPKKEPAKTKEKDKE